jgi:hypothetical protein
LELRASAFAKAAVDRGCRQPVAKDLDICASNPSNQAAAFFQKAFVPK